MKPEILVIEPLLPSVQTKLETAYTVHHLQNVRGSYTGTPNADNIRAVVTGGGTGISRELIDLLPKLEIIAINGVGTDRVDLAYAARKNIRVTNTPGVLADDVADLAIALILSVLRQVPAGDHMIRNGRWAKGESLPLGRSLRGQRLGILGLGQIGVALARRAEVFGMEVCFYNRSPKPAAPWASVESPHALAKESDILAVCMAATPETHQIVDDLLLDALGPTGIIVNVARGTLVDEAALVAALRQNRIAGAGLDVFLDEPHINPEFAELPNVVLVPHQGSATVETRAAMGELVLSNLRAHFASDPLPTAVV